MTTKKLQLNFSTLLLFITSINALQKNNEKNWNLPQCVTKLVNAHFVNSRTIVLTEERFDLNVNFSAVTLVDFKHLHYLNPVQENINHVILTYKKLQALNETLKSLKTMAIFDSRNKYLVIAQSSKDLHQVTQILWHYRLYKSVILLENVTVDIYELDFKTSNCGRNVKPIKVGQFKNGLELRHELFQPDMKTQFRNCPLKVIYSQTVPWIVNSSSGIFVGVLKIFAENNFRLMYMPENPIYSEELQDSYSFQSVKNDFERGYADIFLGLGNNLPHSVMETTTTVYDDNLFWAVSKAERMPYWKAMIRYFPYHFWLSILSLFLTIFVVFCVIARRFNNENYFKDIARTALAMFRIVLNNPIPKIPVNRTLRTLISVYFVISFLTCLVLQARLYDIFSNPVYENDITDLTKLLDSNIPLKFMDGMAILFLFTGPQNQRVFDTYTGTNLTLKESLDEMMIRKDFATIIDTGVLIMTPNCRESVNIFDIAYFQTVIYMRKYHELFEVLNDAVVRIVESGLVNKLVSDTRWDYFLKDRLLKNDGFFQLNLDHFLGAFVVLLFGLSLSFVVFLAELLCGLWHK